MSDTVICQIDKSIVSITLQRPQVCNAINEIMVAELTATLTAISQNDSARALVISGSGDYFCSGSDLHWLHRGAQASPDCNFEDALSMARLLRTLDRLPIPTIALINGPAIGAGAGLVACCDLAVCSNDAWFSIPDTRLGLIPAVIGPYLISKIGSSAARRYFLTAEKFSPATALRVGLVHEVTSSAQESQAQVQSWISDIRQNSPHALTAAKRLITSVDHRPIDDAMLSDTAHRIAHIRTHEEAQEGLSALLGQRAPNWFANE